MGGDNPSDAGFTGNLWVIVISGFRVGMDDKPYGVFKYYRNGQTE